jgi:GT2 family glycosyltransferase
MDVSVIIVNWNTRDLLRSCLDSIYAQAGKYKFEIIVVDNASKDDSCEMVRQFFPEVILIANSTNKGYAGAVNKGLRIARGRYFLILNSDILICDSAIEKTISYANKHLEAAVVGCQVMEDNEKVHMTCRRFPSTLNLLLDTFGLNRIFRMNRFFGREYMWWWP